MHEATEKTKGAHEQLLRTALQGSVPESELKAKNAAAYLRQEEPLQEAIEKMKGAYEELLRTALQDNAPESVLKGVSNIKNAAAYLRQEGPRTKLSYSALRDLSRVFKQKVVTSAPGIDSRREMYFHPSFIDEYVQDYLDTRVVQRMDVIGERQIDNITGPSALPPTPEGSAKPVVEASITTVSSPFVKIAFTSVLTIETFYANPNFLDSWLFYAIRRIEFELHRRLVAELQTNSRLLTVTGQGLPEPRIMDLIDFMRQEFDASAMEGLDFGRNLAVGAIIPRGYWVSRRIQQDGAGQRRQDDLISDLVLIRNDVTNTGPTLVFGRMDLAVYIFDDILITFDRVIDEASDKNLYRFTAELHFSAIPRQFNSQGLSLRVADTAAAIAALT